MSVPIVFCTSYYEFTNIQRSIQIGAKDFLKKPIVYKKVEALLNQVYNQKLINAEEKLILKNQNEVRAIQISDIIYLQTQNKAVVIHTTQCNFVSYQKLYKFEEKLGEKSKQNEIEKSNCGISCHFYSSCIHRLRNFI